MSMQAFSIFFNAGYVECEPPNNRLHKFVGTLTWNDKQYSIDNDKVLLRVSGINEEERVGEKGRGRKEEGREEGGQGRKGKEERRGGREEEREEGRERREERKKRRNKRRGLEDILPMTLMTLSSTLTIM